MKISARRGNFSFQASSILSLLTTVGLCIWFTACSSKSSSSEQRQVAQQTPKFEETTRYDLKGRVVSVDLGAKKLLVDHEAIKGFMEAMTMAYPVKDAALLNGLGPGDQITAQVVVSAGTIWLENIVLVKKAEGTKPAITGQMRIPQPGEEPPSFKLVNQDGKRIQLRQYRPKAVLLTFLYTRCPMPDYCPLMTRNFAEIERDLAKDPDRYSKTHLLSLSFDPEHDTPKVLRAYGQKYELQPGKHSFDHWEFATASPAELEKVAGFFGVFYKKDEGQFVHSLSTAIISPDGKIYKWYHDNTWKPEDVLRDLAGAIASSSVQMASTQR
jgi:protein SCO1/2